MSDSCEAVICTVAGAGRASASAAAASGRAVSSAADANASVSTRVSATAQYFSSGCCDSGSIASFVTALMHRSSPYTSFQCIGAKQLPRCTRSVTTAGSTARPRAERISTLSFVAMPSASASSGCSSTNGRGLSLFSIGTLPVFVIVCH
ncbi:hypothetical protein BamIOP4010DRAFT_5998 [Burkholderia ambifaria IOP40-10]|uniref:Uncharacterized protein n=1 Tax=Burkholderia ambifaria IOP40-10 TaxID=396596 RepID=B1FPN7_9BURK|nr:hypothetical protein BamIOP4010DRAFT_5998 [Burkholderia ambifaria IOP40-10]